jgi:hypothetical protein
VGEVTCQRAGVAHTCVARHVRSVAARWCSSADRGATHSVAPAPSVLNRSPRLGSHDAAAARSTREPGFTPCVTILPRLYATMDECST